MPRLSEEQILNNKDVVEKLIAQFEEPRKSKIIAMFDGLLVMSISRHRLLQEKVIILHTQVAWLSTV